MYVIISDIKFENTFGYATYEDVYFWNPQSYTN